jgi:calcineurin-like phosphoesterase family protein
MSSINEAMKFKATDRVWFTSDLHLGHQNIIKYCNRPWATVEEMNPEIIARWNAVVQPDDEVIVLGDVALGKIRETLPLCKQLNGRLKTLIYGNHDRLYPTAKPSNNDWVSFYRECGFENGFLESYMEVDGQRFLLSHIPYQFLAPSHR